jgi:hypothetical protein
VTRPVYEPTPSRWSSALDYGSQQLFRRPAPASDDFLEVYAYMDTYNGQVLPDNDWWIVEDWEEFMCSPDTGDGTTASRLYPEPGGDAFVMWRDLDGGSDPEAGIDCYVVEVMATFFDNGTDPVPGDWWAVGNLIQTGGSVGNFDRHMYQPADMVNLNSSNHAFSCFAIRIGWTNIGTDKFFGTELGNFCGAVEMFFDTVEMQVYRVGRQGGVDSDLFYMNP